MVHKAEDDADCHFAAAGIAALANFPLWKASAIAQSGFKVEGSNVFVRYYKCVMHPPYKGVAATIVGMTYARGAIFYGSDVGRDFLLKIGVPMSLSQTLPPLLIGTAVQILNQPLVRSTITLQNPSCELKNVRETMVHLYKTKGLSSLWHGVSAGIMKTVPKYVTAVLVKDYFEANLPLVEKGDKQGNLTRSAIKSVAAGVAGAALTNPLDVLRNEMFKTDLGLVKAYKKLMSEEGLAFMTRGMASNVTAVAIPIAVTIFMTDILRAAKHNGIFN